MEELEYMKQKKLSRLTAVVMATMLTATASPLNFTAEAETGYLVRDPFYNYGKGYNYYESEHFQFIWGNSGDASRVTTEFLEGNAKNLEECWDVYMTDLEMAPPSQSVNLSLRDGKEYKTNIYLSGTGLEGMSDDWAYMSYDNGGYAYMFCCVDSMQVSPPSWVLPHEFGHVVTAHQLGWNSNKYSYAWWEALGNWYREQYLYSDYSTDETGHGTDFFETYMKNLSLTFPCGRDYYAAWPFLQYLTENPDNLDGYGKNFVRDMLQQGRVDEYPFDMIERLAPADLKETLGHFAKHMAGLDFENGDAYRARLNELCSAGSWNWQQMYTMLEPVAGKENVYQVPSERAPQHAGLNIVPLTAVGSEISVTLSGAGDTDGNANDNDNWRACIVQQLNDGSCVYSDLFKAGETMTATVQGNLASAYLTVIATPDLDSVTKTGLPYGPDSEFAENNYPFTSKQRYPYTAEITGAEIKKREVATGNNWWESYHNHSNGGGIVSDNATVDASVYVGPNAKVLGSATVTGNARIEDYAVVQDNARVTDNAVISGYAIVAERATVSGNARVDDTGLVMGQANVSGNAKVIESACVYGTYTMTDNAIAKGMAFCMANGSISGQGAVDGDYYDDGGKSVSKGTAFGWVSAQSYVDSLSYTDKLLYAYDFRGDSTYNFTDRYNSTYGLNHGAQWEATRTSAGGVMTLDGNDWLDLDRAVLYNNTIEIQMAVLDRNTGSDAETLFWLGNNTEHINLIVSDNGLELVHTGSGLPLSASNVITDGKWAKIRVVITESSAKIIVDDVTVAEGSIGITPMDIADAVSVTDSSASYRIGADNTGAMGFNGSVDFVRIYSGEATAPTEVYTETEDLSSQTAQVIVGDANYDMAVDIYDLITVRNLLTKTGAMVSSQQFASIDLNGDKDFNVADVVLMQEYLLGRIEEFPAGIYAEYIV